MEKLKRRKLNLAILEVLQRHSDADHRLSQKDIVEILKVEHHIDTDRKCVKRNLTSLIEMGYPINFSETLRMIPGPQGTQEESYILSDFYLEREFTHSELRLLIDSLIFSKHIPVSQCRSLVKKLEGLASHHFKSHVRFISPPPQSAPQNQELFYTIEILDEAIAAGHQVAFIQNSYGTDKRLHPRNDKPRIVIPHGMATANGRYYLIGTDHSTGALINCRLDRITNIQLLDSSAKVPSTTYTLDLPSYMAEHPYMFTGDSIPVTFRMNKIIMNDVIDWFGTAITFTGETDTAVTAHVMVNWTAMRHWALQYCRHIRILAPKNLAETVKSDLKGALDSYEQSDK